MKPALNYMMLHHDDLADEFEAILGYRTSHAALVAVDVLDPTDLAATAVSASQIDLTWTDNSDNESGFVIDYSTDGGNWTRAGTAAEDATSYSITGLDDDTLYYVRVGAYNATGISGYTTDSATTMASYAGHNMVRFDGTSDYLVRGATPTGFITARYFTMAFKFTPNKVAGTIQNIIHFNAANARVLLTAANKVNVVFSIAAFPSALTGTNGMETALTTGNTYTVHIAADFVGGPPVAFLNGVSDIGDLNIPSPGTSADWGTLTNAAIGANPTGTGKLEADVGFFWFTVGNTAADHYITDPTKFYNGGDVDLGGDGTGSGLAQPVIFFGGDENFAADWNAGDNDGSGADTWTMAAPGVNDV
jgi:hypothetical protein